MAYDYTLNGTDIEQYAAAIRILPELFATDRGNNFVLPGIDGEYEAFDKDTGSVDFVLETFLGFTTFYDDKEAISTLLFDKTQTVFLGRTVPLAVPVDVEIAVRPIGVGTTGSGSDRFRVRWPLRAVSPFWREQTQRTSVNPISSITIDGDAHVADAVYTFTGGTTPVLTNNTNGDVITLTDSPGASDVIVDVGARTIKRAGADWDANFEPNKQRWMRLEPGVNSMSLTGAGSVTVDLYEKRR